jgi:hypothetical protein
MGRSADVSPQCKVCAHPQRPQIDLLVAGGASHRSVGAKFGLSHHSIGRHWARHVTQERKTALIMGPVTRAALAARVSEESESVLDHLKAVRAGLYALYDAAVTAGDRNGGALLAGRLHENLGKMAQLTGQLAQSPLLVQNNYFMADPGFMEFQQQLIAVLRRFPEARSAVITEFEKLERSTDNTPTPVGITYDHQEATDAT